MKNSKLPIPSMSMFNTPNQFKFSAIEMDNLGATEYTIVNTLFDETGSVCDFKDELEKCMKLIHESCMKHPKSENLLLRTAVFSSNWGGDQIRELHGFTLLDAIDTSVYVVDPDGGTPLYDAALDCVETTHAYAKTLSDQEYFCNSIFFVVTDGGENCSRIATMSKIRNSLQDMRKTEDLESVKAILIGVNDTEPSLKQLLESFKDEAGFDDYISLGDVTPSKLAKLAQWISQSISSTSQALGSGGASTNVNFDL